MELKNLLIVDDEPDILSILSDLLSDCCDQIFITEKGFQALDILKKNKIQAIISDYHMPDLNGLHLIKILNQMSIHIPIIWLTGEANRELFREAWSLGVYDFFEKPFNHKMIKECLQGAFLMGSTFNESRKKETLQGTEISNQTFGTYSNLSLNIPSSLQSFLKKKLKENKCSPEELIVSWIQAQKEKDDAC